MPSVSLALLTYKELMHNYRLTYAELTHSVFGRKIDHYLKPDIMKVVTLDDTKSLSSGYREINMTS